MNYSDYFIHTLGVIGAVTCEFNVKKNVQHITDCGVKYLIVAGHPYSTSMFTTMQEFLFP